MDRFDIELIIGLIVAYLTSYFWGFYILHNIVEYKNICFTLLFLLVSYCIYMYRRYGLN